MALDTQSIAGPTMLNVAAPAEWWKREPLSILELADPLHVAARGRDGFDPARVVARMRELNATAAHVFPLGCHLDGDVLFFRHHSPGDPPPRFDYLREWLDHSVRAALRTIVYFNVHSVKGAYASRHPDWQCRRFDGTVKDDVYNIESTFCVNSPWREWVFERLRELCAYPIDGIFFDGPVFFDDCCFCAHCRRKFETCHGEAMPKNGAPDDGRMPTLVEFQSDSLCDFVRASRDLIKSINPDLLFYVNANPLQPSRITGRDNRKLAACVDILASEGGFLRGDLLTDGPIWKVGLNAKMLETQAGRSVSSARVPHLVFDSVIHTPWTYSTLPAAEARLLWGSSVAHGAGTWMSAYKDSMDRPAVSAVGELYDFARRQRRALFDTHSIANVAIVCSSPTMNYYAGADVPQTDFTAAHDADQPGNVTRELYGWYHALWTAHVPFDVIDETAIEAGDLSAYRVIVLPNVACMSDACAGRLTRFVIDGGTLVASFQSGVYDAHGRRRAAGALDELLGIRRSDGIVNGPRQWDYLFDHRRVAAGIEACMPSPAFALNVTATPIARALLTFSHPLPDRYADLPADSGRAAVVRHETERGTTFYFACDFGAAIWKWRMPEHLAIVREIIATHADPPLQLPDAPPCLDLSLRRSKGGGNSVLLHLVNYNGGMTRPIERTLPIHDLAVRVRLLPRGARTLFRPVPLPMTVDGDWTSVRLPMLQEYEAIEFQLSS